MPLLAGGRVVSPDHAVQFSGCGRSNQGYKGKTASPTGFGKHGLLFFRAPVRLSTKEKSVSYHAVVAANDVLFRKREVGAMNGIQDGRRAVRRARRFCRQRIRPLT